MVAFNSFCLFHWFYLSFRISFAAFFLSLKREWFVKEMKARAHGSESKVRGAGGRVGVFSGFQQLSGKFYGFDPGLAAARRVNRVNGIFLQREIGYLIGSTLKKEHI